MIRLIIINQNLQVKCQAKITELIQWAKHGNREAAKLVKQDLEITSPVVTSTSSKECPTEVSQHLWLLPTLKPSDSSDISVEWYLSFLKNTKFFIVSPPSKLKFISQIISVKTAQWPILTQSTERSKKDMNLFTKLNGISSTQVICTSSSHPIIALKY